MIRFACPGCEATYSVDDAKGGKAGKCPKCQAQFVIPTAAESAAASPPPPPPSRPSRVPPPPPPPANDGTVEIQPCPKCAARLTVAASDIGVDVECPYCQAVYTAKRPGAAPPPTKRRAADDDPPRSRRAEDDDRPSRRRRDDDEDEDDRPKKRRAVADDDEDDDRPSRRRRDDDEDEDDRPRKKKKRRRSEDPHRGTTIILCAVFGLCCGFLAIAAIIMGFQDLSKMNRGEMDDSGKTATIIGLVLGFLVLGLNILGAVIRVMARAG